MRVVSLLLVLCIGSGLTDLKLYTDLVHQRQQGAIEIARAVASDLLLARAVMGKDPAGEVQALAEQARRLTGAQSVVVINSRGIRCSDPDPKNIGKPVSADPSGALHEQETVSRGSGSLGSSVRAEVPLRDTDGKTVGEVRVDVSMKDLHHQLLTQLPSAAENLGLQVVVGITTIIVITLYNRAELKKIARELKKIVRAIDDLWGHLRDRPAQPDQPAPPDQPIQPDRPAPPTQPAPPAPPTQPAPPARTGVREEIVAVLLWASEPMSAAEIADQIGRDRSTVQRYLKDLKEAGYVTMILDGGSRGRPRHLYRWLGKPWPPPARTPNGHGRVPGVSLFSPLLPPGTGPGQGGPPLGPGPAMTTATVGAPSKASPSVSPNGLQRSGATTRPASSSGHGYRRGGGREGLRRAYRESCRGKAGHRPY